MDSVSFGTFSVSCARESKRLKELKQKGNVFSHIAEKTGGMAG